jgi:DNA topoisomerase I
VVELVDTHVSGACVARHEGSSPSFGTSIFLPPLQSQNHFSRFAGICFCLPDDMEVQSSAVLTHRDFLRIDKDYETAAQVAQLYYVSDKEEGIARLKKGTGFSYQYRGKAVSDSKTLERIKKLVIPPAWTNVWICPSADGHIQVTGFDIRGRKQYKYHPRWAALQHETKFHRMIEFGKMLPDLRTKLETDLAQQGFPEPKVIAMVISVMERTLIRVGNEGYEKMYGSYGLTTLKNNHVNIRGDQVTFSFKGKKGVYHEVKMKSKRFARIIKQCKAIPGKELFQYYDENGDPRRVDSGKINQYLKDCLGMDFTTKDFRTWAGTLAMLQELKGFPPCEKKNQFQKNIVSAFQRVSKKLGNTVAVCRKYYVHPEIVSMYEQDLLNKFFERCKPSTSKKRTSYSSEEKVLMKILQVIKKAKVKL